ncbi:trmt11, partial [Symbiodinium necroappetens]
ADAKKICERSVLVKAILEVWAEGSTWEEVVEACLAQGPDVRRQRRQYLAPPTTICLRVEAFGKTLTVEEKRATMETLRPLFDGDEVVDLRAPDTMMWVLEDSCKAGHHRSTPTGATRRHTWESEHGRLDECFWGGRLLVGAARTRSGRVVRSASSTATTSPSALCSALPRWTTSWPSSWQTALVSGPSS